MAAGKQDSQPDALVYRFNVHAEENDGGWLQEIPQTSGDADKKVEIPTLKPFSHPLEVVDRESDDSDSLPTKLPTRPTLVSKTVSFDDKSSGEAQAGKKKSVVNSEPSVSTLSAQRAHSPSQPTWKQIMKEKEKSIISGLKTRIHTKFDTLKDRVNELSNDSFDRWRAGASGADSTESINPSRSLSADSLVKEPAIITPVSADILHSSHPRTNENVSAKTELSVKEAVVNVNGFMSELPVDEDELKSVYKRDFFRQRSASAADLEHGSDADEVTEESYISDHTYSTSVPLSTDRSQYVDDSTGSSVDTSVEASELIFYDPFGGSELSSVPKNRATTDRAPAVLMSDLNTDSNLPVDSEARGTRDTVQNAEEKSDSLQNLPEELSSESNQPLSHLALLQQTVANQRTGLCVLVAMYAVALCLPSFISGFTLGLLLAVSVYYFYCLSRISFQSPAVSAHAHNQSYPHIKQPHRVDNVFKGWMNELRRYEENTYHISQTHSVFITLDGSTLRMQRPSQGVSKRALWTDQIGHVMFRQQRYYELRGARVFLIPTDLVRKRWWSKKYPICIEIPSPSSKQAKASFGQSLSSNDIALSSSESRNNISSSLSSRDTDKKTVVIYLFARAAREKEEWFRRFFMAANGTPLPVSLAQFVASRKLSDEQSRQLADRSFSGDGPTEQTKTKHRLSAASLKDATLSSTPPNNSEAVPLQTMVHESMEDRLANYLLYMGRFMSASNASQGVSVTSTSAGSSTGKTSQNETSQPDKTSTSDTNKSALPDSDLQARDKPVPPVPDEGKLDWLNALLGRLFYDFLHEPKWTSAVQNKVQHKISKLHVPYFIDELVVRDVDVGKEIPVIRSVLGMHVDERGLWIDLSVVYNGGFQATMETKVNLMKLKKERQSSGADSMSKVRGDRSAVTHSSEEDSGESSSEEEKAFDGLQPDGTNDQSSSQQPGMSKKIMQWVDKIASSRYFQQATEYKYIKRAMEEVSNTPIVLTAELRSIVGTLTVNIPPPPTDRIWFGFRPMPQLVISAKPRVGERQVSLTHITDWIEHKLALEFQRVFVLPNMDDIYLPIMVPLQHTA